MLWDEFQQLTLAQWEALEERRVIQIRHERYNAALIAATICNANRASAESDWVSPFDFLPGFEDDPREKERAKYRKQVIKSIRSTFVAMARLNASTADVEAMKVKVLGRLQAAGHADAAELMREAFPNF